MISDEAVEVATRLLHPGLFESDGLLHPALAVSGQVQARTKVRAALEAAYPVIRQHVAEQIAVAIEARRSEITPGRPGWVYLTEAIDKTREIGGGQ